MKRIFILNGHPAERSLSRTLVEAYADAARQAGHEVRLTHLHDLAFDADFGWVDYQQPKALEPALEQLLQDLSWSEHFMMSTPMWWGGLPAKLKGLFEGHPARGIVAANMRRRPKHQNVDAAIGFAVPPHGQGCACGSSGPRLAPPVELDKPTQPESSVTTAHAGC